MAALTLGGVLILAQGAGSGSDPESGSDRIWAWIGTPLFGLTTLWFAYLAVNRTPALALDSDGIKASGVRRLAWDEIERMSVVEVETEDKKEFELVLELAPGHRGERATRWFVFELAGNYAPRPDRVTLSLQKLERRREEVVAEIERLSGRTVEWKLLPKSRWRERLGRARRS